MISSKTGGIVTLISGHLPIVHFSMLEQDFCLLGRCTMALTNIHSDQLPITTSGLCRQCVNPVLTSWSVITSSYVCHRWKRALRQIREMVKDQYVGRLEPMILALSCQCYDHLATTTKNLTSVSNCYIEYGPLMFDHSAT